MSKANYKTIIYPYITFYCKRKWIQRKDQKKKNPKPQAKVGITQLPRYKASLRRKESQPSHARFHEAVGWVHVSVRNRQTQAVTVGKEK